jgi:AcrR family transcriptional regulator
LWKVETVMDVRTGGERDGARERLLEAAARHFAEHGFEGASQRAIQRDAAVNSAAAHYYFGSKEALYQEVIKTHLAGIQAERQRRMDAISDEARGHVRLRALVNAYIAPHMELALSANGRPYGRILARVLIEPVKSADSVFDEIVSPLRERFVAELRELFPDASYVTISKMVSTTVILMAGVPYNTTWTAMTDEEQTQLSSHIWVEAVGRFACAGIEALGGKLSA